MRAKALCPNCSSWLHPDNCWYCEYNNDLYRSTYQIRCGRCKKRFNWETVCEKGRSPLVKSVDSNSVRLWQSECYEILSRVARQGDGGLIWLIDRRKERVLKTYRFSTPAFLPWRKFEFASGRAFKLALRLIALEQKIILNYLIQYDISLELGENLKKVFAK